MSWQSEIVEARRARIIELAAKGLDNGVIAQRLGVPQKVVSNVLAYQRRKESA